MDSSKDRCCNLLCFGSLYFGVIVEGIMRLGDLLDSGSS